jgi:hypothetical protein
MVRKRRERGEEWCSEFRNWSSSAVKIFKIKENTHDLDSDLLGVKHGCYMQGWRRWRWRWRHRLPTMLCVSRSTHMTSWCTLASRRGPQPEQTCNNRRRGVARLCWILFTHRTLIRDHGHTVWTIFYYVTLLFFVITAVSKINKKHKVKKN